MLASATFYFDCYAEVAVGKRLIPKKIKSPLPGRMESVLALRLGKSTVPALGEKLVFEVAHLETSYE